MRNQNIWAAIFLQKLQLCNLFKYLFSIIDIEWKKMLLSGTVLVENENAFASRPSPSSLLSNDTILSHNKQIENPWLCKNYQWLFLWYFKANNFRVNLEQFSGFISKIIFSEAAINILLSSAQSNNEP